MFFLVVFYLLAISAGFRVKRPVVQYIRLGDFFVVQSSFKLIDILFKVRRRLAAEAEEREANIVPDKKEIIAHCIDRVR